MPSLAKLADNEQRFLSLTVEAAIRIGLLGMLAVWCFDIARPFLIPFLWGVIIAVAVYPAYAWLEARLGGRRLWAAALFTLFMLVLLVLPSVLLAGSLVTGVRNAATIFQAGTLQIPPPPEGVVAWPVVGEPLHRLWLLASDNLQEAVAEVGPVLTNIGKWLLGAAAGTGLALLQFLVAVIVSGILLAHAEQAGSAARAIARRLAPERGLGFKTMAARTVRSVATGILGVALLQGILAGLGFLVAGVPAAGLLTIVCIVLGVIQIGVVIVLIPAVAYLFATADTTTAVAFLVYAVLIAPLDNILKPMLLGRGVKVPMVVVFVGAIGGFINSGIIGLFLGAVVLTLGYGLLMAWLHPDTVGEQAADIET